jgi:predicted metal-dependent HD superfamily phosphohydrolase
MGYIDHSYFKLVDVLYFNILFAKEASRQVIGLSSMLTHTEQHITNYLQQIDFLCGYLQQSIDIELSFFKKYVIYLIPWIC